MIGKNLVLAQDYTAYAEEDHATWALLCEKQKDRQKDLSLKYLDGYEKLGLDTERIVRIEEVSQRLDALCSWTLIPVGGLIPTRDFFYMLINKKYPVTVYMRRPWEVEFSEQPDIFHDVLGHLPLLTNQRFIQFLTAYSIIALKYINNDRAIEFLGRLYWYTYEMGVIDEEGQIKPYGGALITSAGELANLHSPGTPKHPFDLDHIFRTPYNPYQLQQEYFVINSFDDLFNCLGDLEARLIEHLLLPAEDNTVRNYPLNPHIGTGFNNVIGFLNDIQYRYPEAISFVAGQPDESFFNVSECIAKFSVYADHLGRTNGHPASGVANAIGQYNRTKGIINDIVAEYLWRDESIRIRPDHLLMTVGAQEAFAVIVSTICRRDKDVIMVEDPGYVGLSSFGKIFGHHLEPIRADEEGIDLKALKSKVIAINRTGKSVKLLYVIPDYQNPSGHCMPIGNRLRLLELARQYNFLIVEDSVYNSFTYAQMKNPTLKSLDRYNRVIYVGSFAKSLFPGLRIGLIAADQYVENEAGVSVALIDEMVKVKAHLTNNTPTINQAMLGGLLLESGYSLREWSRPKFEAYRRKRDCMVGALHRHVGTYSREWAEGIRWNEPDGGFFLKLEVSFPVDDRSVEDCARRYGVIFCPMRYFYLENGGQCEIRLTFSNVTPENIELGVGRLAAWLKEETEKAVGARLEQVETFY